jgi:hypothetical protein
MQVVWAVGSPNPLLTVVPADSREQIALDGDFGGGCFLENKSRALVGVASFNARSLETEEVNVAGYVPTSAFSRWALPLISDPSQRLICHGRECLTNPTPLPDRLSQEVAWRPCSGQLTGPGSYPFGYELVYDMELNYDSVLMNGSFHTGPEPRPVPPTRATLAIASPSIRTAMVPATASAGFELTVQTTPERRRPTSDNLRLGSHELRAPRRRHTRTS